MKTENEITEELHAAIDEYKRLGGLFVDAIKRKDDIKDIQNISNDMDATHENILELKRKLGHF
jgi:hypothetical protein